MAIKHTKPTGYDSNIWASGASDNAATAAQINAGWNSTTPPTYQVENFEQNRQDEFLAHINELGIPYWDNITVYTKGSLATFLDGTDMRIFFSNVDSNTGNTPLSGIEWSVIDNNIRPTTTASGTISKVAVVAGTNPAITLAAPAGLPFADTSLSNVTGANVAKKVIAGTGITSVTSADAITLSVPPAGTVLNTQTAVNAGVATTAVVLALTDTLPAITDGAQVDYCHFNITPRNNLSRFKIDVTAFTSSQSSGEHIIVMLFRDSVCIGTCVTFQPSDSTVFQNSCFSTLDEPNLSSPINYSLRFACDTGRTVNLNSNSNGNRIFAGAMATRITVSELAG